MHQETKKDYDLNNIQNARFCERILSNDGDFFKTAGLSYESKFLLSRFAKMQIYWVWDSKRPNEVYFVPQSSHSMTVLYDIPEYEIIGSNLSTKRT